MLGIDDLNKFTADLITAHLTTNQPSVWDATSAAFTAAFPDEHIEKVGLAREVVRVLDNAGDGSNGDPLDEAAAMTRANFKLLLGTLADLLRDARTTEDDSQQRNRVERLVRGFLDDHQTGVTRDRARILFRDIDKALEDTDQGDARRSTLAGLRRRYELDSEPLEQVADYQRFRDELKALPLQERLATQDRPAPDNDQHEAVSLDPEPEPANADDSVVAAAPAAAVNGATTA